MNSRLNELLRGIKEDSQMWLDDDYPDKTDRAIGELLDEFPDMSEERAEKLVNDALIGHFSFWKKGKPNGD